MKAQYSRNLFAGLILSLVIVFSAACTAFDDPDPRPLPTSLATVPPYTGSRNTNEAVIDPVSDLVPKADDEVIRLMEEVSQQQLQVYVRTLENFGTRNTYSSQDEPDFGVGAARRWIFNEFDRVGNGNLLVTFDDFSMDYAGIRTEQRNVIATLPGTRGTGVIILMAHYDTRPRSELDGETLAPGANDNASGIALLLETARILSSREWNQTIIFAAFAAEEQGTFGSRNYAQNAFLDGTNVIAAMNFDQVGGEDGIPFSIRMFAQDLQQSPNGELGRYIEYMAGLYQPFFPITVIDALDREGRYGDHREFVSLGIPSVRFTQSVEDPDLVNSGNDRWQRIDYDYHATVVRMVVAVSANLLGGPPTPDTPLIFDADQVEGVQVVWSAADNADGYVFSFRPLISPSYPTFRYVRANQAGNVIFTDLRPGVQYAVSMAGLSMDGRLGDFTPEVLLDLSREAAASD